MQNLKRVLKILAIALLLLILVAGVGGYWFITKSHPQINGTLRVPGLKAQVEIIRDSLGVSHIYASNVDDLMVASGYVQAQDRLWQMDFNRRVGRGTLSDVLGAGAIRNDRFLRTIGLARSAEADWTELSDEAKRGMQFFANGVNAFVESHQDNLPIEYTFLGVKPVRWEPIDSLMVGKVIQYGQSGSYDADLYRARLIEKFGAPKAKEIMPPYPEEGPFILSAPNPVGRLRDSQLDDIPSVQIGVPDLRDLAALNLALGKQHGDGSNNWVIDGTKSATGKPILASDQHLGIQMPSIWYEIGLHCAPQNDACPFNVAGVTFPGVPLVVVGRNDRIAWGITNAMTDVQDLFVEKVNPQNPNQSEYQGKWEEMQIVEEPIKVKGVVSETLRIQITRHGPIVTPVIRGLSEPVALEWTLNTNKDKIFDGILLLNRARNWNDFRRALSLWGAPSFSIVYADMDGNIGYQMVGRAPIRAKGQGNVPVPGWTGEYEWQGYVPFDEMPAAYNPPTHSIASANNAAVPSTYKYWLSSDYAAPYRAQRITDLLKSKDKLSVEDFKAIQGDTFSIPEARLQKFIIALKPEGFLQERAMEYVKGWDGRLTVDNVGGTILSVTYQRAIRNLYANKMDADLLDTLLGARDFNRRALLALLDQPESEWWDNPTTPRKETRDDILKKSYAEAVDWLGSQYGDAPNEWRWSRLHTATFAHPLGSVQPLNLLFNAGPVGVPAGDSTVFRAGFSDVTPYGVTSITSQRQIFDLSSTSSSIMTHTTGQSGQPLNKHYTDMIPMWRDVQYAPLFFDRAELDKVKEGALMLVP